MFMSTECPDIDVYNIGETGDIYGHDSSKYRDLTMVYTNENWFVSPFVIDILGTEFPRYLTIVFKIAQLRTKFVM